VSDKPLPPQGREREIFLRALRAYSEDCPEPPVLHPDCPFAIPISDGRTCFEECRDILAEYEVPPRADEIRLGNGLVMSRILRPRARRPDKQAKPYDSLEVLRLEEHLSLRDRSLAALLRGLEQLVEQVPVDNEERSRRIRHIADVLSERGLDAAAVIQHGMAKKLVSYVVAIASAPWLVKGDDAVFPHALGWAALLDEVADLSEQPPDVSLKSLDVTEARLQASFESDFFRLVSGWFAWAPFDRLISYSPPSTDEFLNPPHTDQEERDRIQWMTERFTQTYLSDWSETSLHLEWRYIHSETKPPCLPAEMRRRAIPEDELACEIANRASRERGHEQRDLGQRFIKPGLQFLRAGRRSEAAALFEAVRRLTPDDAAAQNNYGFCLLPDQPDIALTALEQASRLGYKPISVNVGNRLLALYRLGRLTTALDLADHSFEACLAENLWGGTMWDYEAKIPKLIDVEDVRNYTIGLAFKIAQASGVAELEELWKRRYEATFQADDEEER
jgi:tetratricopeptide (TPR) repeat protein